MKPVSVVIITRNEENNIVDCIRSARLISSDIIVVDSGSRDRTVELAGEEGARVFQISWQGYGYSRNYGAQKARNHWVFAMDADERISTGLADSVNNLDLSDPSLVYKFRRQNFIGQRLMKFGTPGYDHVVRIYHRHHCEWDKTLVHEKLVFTNGRKKQIPGYIIHYAFRNVADYKSKTAIYAQMSAEKYLLEERRAGFTKRFISPVFNSAKSYFFQLGFLEGRLGILVAVTIARYTWLKYYHLRRLRQQGLEKRPSFATLTTIETVSKPIVP